MTRSNSSQSSIEVGEVWELNTGAGTMVVEVARHDVPTVKPRRHPDGRQVVLRRITGPEPRGRLRERDLLESPNARRLS